MASQASHATHAPGLPRTQSPAQLWILRTLLVIAGSAFIALCAHIALPLPWTPVPITFQPFAVILLGMLFGPWIGASCAALYLVEGISGLPVFTHYGPGGIAQLLGPTGGYLMSYPFTAAIAGFLYTHGSGKHDRRRNFWFALAIAIAASILTLLCGASWMFAITHSSARTIATASVLPFLPGDFLKCALGAAIACAWFRSRTRQA